MILLGAGASKPFGIPTLQEFSNDFINDLKNRGYEDLVFDIQSVLEKFGMPLDFESIYSTLESLYNPLNFVKKAGPAVVYFLKNPEILPKSNDFSQALQEARNIIYNKCTVSDENFPTVRSCYDGLIRSVNSMMSKEGKKWERGTALIDVTNVIFTTNYDMSLEWYFNEKEKGYMDGYEPVSPFIKKYNPQILYRMNSGDSKNRIIKLHGSIWQFIRNKEMIKTNVNPYSNLLPYKINVEEQMMIYPTKEKDILNHQYFPFFHLYKNWNWSRLIVIGFSFRDEPINSTIIENMITIPESRMIIVNPHPEEVLINLQTYTASYLSNKIPVDRIHLIQGKFGEESTFKQIFDMSNEIYGK
jgi:hypothetical protein